MFVGVPPSAMLIGYELPTNGRDALDMWVPSIALPFHVYAASMAAGTQILRVLRSFLEMATILLTLRKNRSTLHALWFLRAAGWSGICSVEHMMVNSFR